jgi:hypothetical protein
MKHWTFVAPYRVRTFIAMGKVQMKLDTSYSQISGIIRKYFFIPLEQ